MNLSETSPVSVAIHLVIAAGSLFLLVLGLRLAMGRRLPRWLRFGRPAQVDKARSTRIGVGVALISSGSLIQQATSLIPVPFVVEAALLGSALLVVVAALPWVWRD